MKPEPSPQFQYIQERHDEFLALWPHRHDYIWAEHPNPREKPTWQTESRHPLSDRLIRQGSHLYGVRFGATTQYCLLDIDRHSRYHPEHDPQAIPRILAALEPLGLVSGVFCTSSYSGGLHLYFPFEQPQKTHELATALTAVLESAGFKLAYGQLEIFPNSRTWSATGHPPLYAAHRLPLQNSSYLLTLQGTLWQEEFGDQASFVRQWRFASSRNDISSRTVERVTKTLYRKRYGLRGKADKFLNDLNAEIEAGWSEAGQTNHLLGRITMRAYIFDHLLHSCHPLEGQELVNHVVTIAQSLPGYSDYCNHQHEIEKRAEEWANCIQKSHYFHYGGNRKQKDQTQAETTAAAKPNWNQEQSQTAREKIRLAIADLLNQDALPARVGERFQLLTRSYRISGQTLYKHPDLWHPNYLWKTPQTPLEEQGPVASCTLSAEATESPTSLLGCNGCKQPAHQLLHDDDILDQREGGCNRERREGESQFDGPQFIQQVFLDLQQQQQLMKTRQQHQQQQREAEQQEAYHLKMVSYLATGDPILMAEAEKCLHWLPPDVPRSGLI